MQIVKQQEIVVHDAHGNSKVYEYYMQDKKIDLCVVNVNGRVPEKGQLVNSEYTCVCYVLDGEGEFCGQAISKGDAFNILSAEKYWFDGNFSMVMSGTPAFDPGQNKIVD